jgi:hypothetical protein
MKKRKMLSESETARRTLLIFDWMWQHGDDCVVSIAKLLDARGIEVTPETMGMVLLFKNWLFVEAAPGEWRWRFETEEAA